MLPTARAKSASCEILVIVVSKTGVVFLCKVVVVISIINTVMVIVVAICGAVVGFLIVS